MMAILAAQKVQESRIAVAVKSGDNDKVAITKASAGRLA